MAAGRIRQYIFGTNWLKTIRINFHYFPFKQAIRMPILVAYRTVFQCMEGGVNIETPLSTGMLLLGYHRLGINDGNRTIWNVCGTLTLKGKSIDIGRGSSLCISGNCYLGNRFTMTGKSTVLCRKLMDFGENVLISWDVLLIDSDYHIITDSEGNIINKEKPIVIGDNVWVGCRTTILKGTTIPSNSIIAAGSVISGKMQKESCIYSTDRRIIKENITWQR